MPIKDIKKSLYEELSRIGKAVSSSARMELLEYLSQGEKSVESLSDLAGMSIANTSQHLQHLKNSGIIVSRKEGLHVYYKIVGDDVIRLIISIRNLAENHLSEVSRIINDVIKVKDKIAPVKALDLIEKVKKGQVTVIDVRPEDEFDAGHFPGSINIPFDDLHSRMPELNSKQEIIAYCRGPYCMMTFDTVTLLRQKGFKAKRLAEGFPEYKISGLPIEKSEKKKKPKKKKGSSPDSWII